MTMTPHDLIRQSLLNSLGQHYGNLRQMIMALPIEQSLIGVMKGLSYLDDGIVWIEKCLLQAELKLAVPPKKTGESEGMTPGSGEEGCAAVQDACVPELPPLPQGEPS